MYLHFVADSVGLASITLM